MDTDTNVVTDRDTDTDTDTNRDTDRDTDTDTETETDIISYLFVPVYGSVTPSVGSRDSPLETGDKCILTVDSYDPERL